jgi:LuxR family maltose regulon positive regulatory protein
VPAVASEARRLRAVTEDPDAAHLGLGEELRALALITVGVTEFWAGQLDQGERHLDQGVVLAQQIGRPFLEFSGLAHQAAIEIYRSFARAAERSMQAIELAERHGWTDEPAAGVAYVTLAGALAWQGRTEEAEPWLQRAERTIRAEAEPAARMAVHYLRGRLVLARGHHADALAALRAAERLAGRLTAPHLLIPRTRASLMHVLARLGDTERRASPRRPRRTRPRARGDTHGYGRAAARPARPGRGDRRARTGPRAGPT